MAAPVPLGVHSALLLVLHGQTAAVPLHLPPVLSLRLLVRTARVGAGRAELHHSGKQNVGGRVASVRKGACGGVRANTTGPI